MTSYQYDIGEMPRAASRFIASARREVQAAFAIEKKERKLTQLELAHRLGVNKSVISRQLSGLDNMTLRSVAELLWAMGWKPKITAHKLVAHSDANESPPKIEARPPKSSAADLDFLPGRAINL